LARLQRGANQPPLPEGYDLFTEDACPLSIRTRPCRRYERTRREWEPLLACTSRGCDRSKPDGERNGFRIERLKDKLGTRSNAPRRSCSSTVGEPARGGIGAPPALP
jgi:hypothetical protein